jgi:hypothetical protein
MGGRQAGTMSAQGVATGVGFAALTALLLGVGLPAVLPPESVPAIQIVDPTSHGVDVGRAPPTEGDDDDADDRFDDGTDDGVDTDDSPDDDDDEDDDDDDKDDDDDGDD